MRTEEIPGVAALWARTVGHPEIRIAVLDGVPDLSHPCFRGSHAQPLALGIGPSESPGRARAHGTHIASLILANDRTPVRGIAFGCTGLLGTIFPNSTEDDSRTCTQDILAYAIRAAVRAGANIINVSAGSFAESTEVSASLKEAVAQCEDYDVLVVAAAGNDGCRCVHLPAHLPSVLAVGAIDDSGQPADFSNWGPQYSANGLLAQGVDILGAYPGGGARKASGTSQAAAIVSGCAGLLMALQRKIHGRMSGRTIRRILLETASACPATQDNAVGRCLVGRLNLEAALNEISQRRKSMTIESVLESSSVDSSSARPAVGSEPTELRQPTGPASGMVELSDCGCGGSPGGCSCGMKSAGSTPPQLVFPIGRLGYDYPNKTGRDSLRRPIDLPNPDDKAALARLLLQAGHTELAEEFIWTVEVDGEPIYAIEPAGAYAKEAYHALVEFLRDQEIGPLQEGEAREGGEPEEGRRGRRRAHDEEVAPAPPPKAEYCAVPGTVVGRRHLYLAGKDVDIIRPALRGMANWSLPLLIGSAAEQYANLPAPLRQTLQTPSPDDVLNFLRILFSELRNEGRAPEDRAKNFVAINFAEMLVIFAKEVAQRMALESIDVRPTPVRPAGSDRWDIVLAFFKPTDQLGTAVTEYPITVDVNYVVPTIVRVGPPRQRSMRIVKT
jgi:hypothetical protein